MDDRATASQGVPHDQLVDAFLLPSQLLTFEMLRRPLEFTQFTSDAFTSLLRTAGVQISMDGRGRALDNVFVERLWRSVKYEEVYLKDYDSVPAARAGLGDYFAFYNHERPHQALAYRTPAEVYGEVPAVVLASAPSGY